MEGRHHHRVTLVLAGVTLIAPIVTGDVRALAMTAGALTGLVVEPDLDVDHRTHSENLVYRHAGRAVGLLWQIYWYPYALLNPHRGVSHWPLVGTLTRALYLLAPAIAAWAWQGWPVPWAILGYWFAGLCLADLAHIVLD